MNQTSNTEFLSKSQCICEKDLFEELKCNLCCDYISDIKCEPFLSEAKKIMKTKKLDMYSLSMLADVAEYLYGEKIVFQEVYEAEHFFGEKNSDARRQQKIKTRRKDFFSKRFTFLLDYSEKNYA